MREQTCKICGGPIGNPRKRTVCSKECNTERRRRGSTKHGEYGTRLYRIWNNMKNRCKGNCQGRAKANYCDRGISVCVEWSKSFETFRGWAMANGYSDDLELDRRNTDGGYEPDNCRWTNGVNQARNRRKRSDALRSKYKGVSPITRSARWSARATANGTTEYLGAFDTEQDAARAYDDFARKNFGEFAHTNF